MKQAVVSRKYQDTIDTRNQLVLLFLVVVLAITGLTVLGKVDGAVWASFVSSTFTFVGGALVANGIVYRGANVYQKKVAPDVGSSAGGGG